jgi:hypothetical protein
VEGAGISYHSPLLISIGTRKKGQSLQSIVKDSFASDVEIGTGEDLTTAFVTCAAGSARRLRAIGVPEEPLDGAENSIHTLSATPPSLPSKHLRLISS